MKRIIFVAVFLIIGLEVVHAQNSAVTNAILYQQDGNLTKAKQQIDLASVHEKTISQAKTFYYKGLIYKEIYKSPNVEVKQLSLDPLSESTAYFLKAKALENNPKGEYTKLVGSHLDENWVNLVNSGSAYIQSKRYEDALKVLQLAQEVNPNDTTAYVYGAYAAEALKKTELLREYSIKLLTLNNKTLYVYSNIITYAYESKDYQSAIDYSNKALEVFPYQKSILQLRTLAYQAAGKYSEGVEVLKAELLLKPYEIELLTSLAVLYNAQQNKDKAMEVYRKIIAIEPHHFFANFNSCLLNLEKGNERATMKDPAGAKEYFTKALENAKRAKALAVEDEDLDNLSKVINDLKGLLGN